MSEPWFKNPRTGWFLLWLYRVILALFIIQGADVPDEWWQSTEVAEHVVFGKGELTWEWREGLRSYTYPLPFIVVFKLLQLIGADVAFPSLLFYIPRIMAATVCFLVDRATAQVAYKRIYPRDRAFTLSLLLTTLGAWFIPFVGVRTQSNVVEALMLLWALQEDSFAMFTLCCGLGCALRVTFAVPAAVVFCHRIYDRCIVGVASENEDEEDPQKLLCDDMPRDKKDSDNEDDVDANSGSEKKKKTFSSSSSLKMNIDRLLGLRPRRADRDESVAASLLMHLAVTASAVLLTLLLVAAIDRIFYGRWLCAPLNFLVFNVVSGLSKLFGTHPVHWYFTSALPLMFLTLTPMIAFGWKGLNAAQPPLAFAHRPNAEEHARRSTQFILRLIHIIVVSSLLLSCLGHKEMRFLYFCVPLAVLITAAAWATDAKLWRKRQRWTTIHVLVNLCVLFFFGLFWQEAPIAATKFIRHSAAADPRKRAQSLHALTHCFALPGESFFHGATSDFVQNTCPVVLATPNEQEPGHARYSVVQPTASDTFLESPLEFVEYLYEGRPPPSVQFKRRMDICCSWRKMPDRIVMYDVHVEVLRPFLERNMFVQKKSFFHTWFPLEEYQGKTMVYFERVE